MPRSAVTLCLCALLLAAAAGCRGKTASDIRGGPIVQQRRIASSPEVLRKVAVIPLYPAESLGRAQAGASPPETPTGPEAILPQATPGASRSSAPPARWEIAALLSNFVAQALVAHGIDAVAPNDVELAFTGEGHAVPRLDPLTAARLSDRFFAATGVVLGRVLRYRERQGGAGGATRAASVAFEISLYEAPSGRRLWVGRFDETQPSITQNVFRARQYPHSGTRWLSAPEMARWGADRSVAAMTESQQPSSR